jgi:hypothetical protein
MVALSTNLMITCSLLLLLLLFVAHQVIPVVAINNQMNRKTRSTLSYKTSPGVLRTNKQLSIDDNYPWLAVTTKLIQVDSLDNNQKGDTLFTYLTENLMEIIDSSETNGTYSHFTMDLPHQSPVEKGMMFISPPVGGNSALNIGTMIDIRDCNLVALELSENDISVPPTLCPETTFDSLFLTFLTHYILTIKTYDSESCLSISERVEKCMNTSKNTLSASTAYSPLLREMILIEDPNTLKAHPYITKDTGWRSADSLIIVHIIFRKVLPPKIENLPYHHRGLVRTGTVRWYDRGSKMGSIRPDKFGDPDVLFKNDNMLVKNVYSRGDHVAFQIGWTKINQTNIVNHRATIENVTIPLSIED